MAFNLFFFLSSSLHAVEVASPSPDFFWTKFFFGSFIMFVTYVALTWPERRRKAQARLMIDSLKIGDTVLTGSGIVGEIQSIEGKFMTLQFPSGYSIVVIKESIIELIAQEKFLLENK